MNKNILFYICFFLITFLSYACNDSGNTSDVNFCLRQLVNVGYSIKELSIRSDYSESELIKAYQTGEKILSDTAKNNKIFTIFELNDEEKIIPVNKSNISAYDAIWQIYTKAQNLPRTSLYTGIGVSKVACALMKRKPLTDNDSIRALVGYVNLKYELNDMPPSIDKYYTKTTTLKDVVVPVTFHPNVSDEIKLKIDYYIYQNEQLELKANENLHKSLDSKIDAHISKAIDDFINDDIASYLNIGKGLFMDSLEETNFYCEKLSKRLSLDELNKNVRDEIITYCVSVNCSRAILINEVLNYKDYTNQANISDRILLEKYVAQLENITNIMEKQKQKLGVDAGAMAITIPFGIATAGVMNPATSILSIQAAKVFLVETMEYEGLDGIVKDAFNYSENEKSIEDDSKKLGNKLKSDLNKKMTESLKGKNSYYETLNNNTKQYYQQVRDYFQIK